MGRYFKDSYANTYAARNVKEALDRLIDVLQSPAQVRKLVIGTAARKPLAPKLPAGKTISSESPASTPQGMDTSASAAKKQLRNPKNAEPQALKESQKGDAITPPSSGNGPVEKKMTPSSSGSRASQASESGDSNFQEHIPVGRFTQVTGSSLSKKIAF